MCGIIGFNWQDKPLLRKALKKIYHRGPDDSGTYEDKYISLGHRRLSIMDLSKAGKQPMSNEDETLWIVFNGEIYNFQELKAELKNKHTFKSNSDTEILLHLYEEYGFEMLSKLQGMFAFAIYDSKKKELFIARDRVGIKPLYYYKEGKKFIFASEIKAILQEKSIKREVNSDALSSFLTFRANTLENSMFKGIKKLMPSHFLIYNLKANKFKISKYWILNFSNKKINPEKELIILLNDAVKSRLMSDVPYGSYLSGGVDSGTLVSLMGRFSSQPIKTFSVGFEQEQHSEAEEARFIAENLETDHHELLIKEDSVKNLPSIIYHADEPVSDPTSIPLYLLSKYTKKYCTVILTGEGSDELFAGYPQYKFMKIHHSLIRKIPNPLRAALPVLVKSSPNFIIDKVFKFSSALGDKGIQRFSNFVNSDNYSSQYLNQISIFNEEEQSELLNQKINLYEKYRQIYFKNITSDKLLTACQYFDFSEPLVDDLLMKVDKNTMAFAIEGRVPFLDYRIVELAAKIPSSLKLRGFTKDKFILRKSVKGLIPEQTRNRPKKHFFVPIDSWFKHELSTLRSELLSKQYINKQKIFNYNYIEKVNKNFSKSRLFYSRQLWSLIVFQIWYKQFIENEKIQV
ncbi:MAG: asparagine synthase (glutamine-hydrolyzing) [archaeon]